MKTVVARLGIALVPVCVGALALALAPAEADASITGNCKSVELTFENDTGGRIDVPQSGHRVKNPGSVEGWNKLTLGASKSGIASGSSWSNTLTLSVKCVSDAEFEIKWSDSHGDHMSTFKSVNISDKAAKFSLK